MNSRIFFTREEHMSLQKVWKSYIPFLFISIILFYSKVCFAVRADIDWGDWESMGLENCNVSSIIYTNKTEKIIAGTDKGRLIL